MEPKTIDWLILRLRQLRKSRCLTQEKFAELSGISYKYYQAIEAGRKRELRLSTLERLARAYGIRLSELFQPPSSDENRALAIIERKNRYGVSKRRKKRED